MVTIRLLRKGRSRRVGREKEVPKPMIRVKAVHRYPVKGLSYDALETARVLAGETLPSDRRWAIEHGPSKFDPAAPVHRPKIAYLMLMRNERLAELRTSFEADGSVLTVRDRAGGMLAEGSLKTTAGRSDLETFFEGYCATELRARPRIVSAPGHAFTDTAAKCLSLINLATVRDIADRLGVAVDPLRFRANLLIEGAPAWSERAWIGRRLRIGPVAMEASARIERCAATNVNPETGQRDLTLPRSLLEHYGHADCGIYLWVMSDGTIAPGDRLEPPG